MSDIRFCGACGQPNSTDARFCGKCGAPLPAMAAPAPAAPAPAAPAPAAPAPSRPAVASRTLAGASIDPAELAAHVARVRAGVEPTQPAGLPAMPQQPAMQQPMQPAMQPMAPKAPWEEPPPPAGKMEAATLIDMPIMPDPGASKQPMKTMLGMSFPELAQVAPAPLPPAPVAAPAPVAPAPLPPAPVAAPALPPAPVAAPASAPLPPAPVATSAETTSDRPRDAILRSMLSAPSSSAPAAPSPAAKAPMKTMLGMALAPPAVAMPNAMPSAMPNAMPSAMPSASAPVAAPAPLPPIAQQPASVPAAMAPAPAPAAPVSPPAPIAPEPPHADPAVRKQLGPSHRTMLGAAPPPDLLAKAQAAMDARPPSAPPGAMPPVSPPAVTPEMSGDMSIAGLPSPRRRTNALLVVVLLLGALLVAGSIGAWLVFGRGGGRAVAVTVARAEAGEVLRIDVPGIPAGARARFGGTETPFTGTAAELPLAGGTLHVGDNPLSIELVLPDGTVEPHQVTLTLSYRVRADLAELGAADPAVSVVVEAIAGSAVVLDGEALTLDASGRGTRRYPLSAMTPTDGVVVHVAHYTVTPPATSPGGAPATGELTTRIPVTTLHLDRPGDDAVTDRDAVEIAGAVVAGATLTIDGAPVTVLPEGRFLHRYPLPAPGEFGPRLVASAPGHAPAVRTLRIRRVADLAREAASFTYDRTLTYARLRAAPTTFTSQRVMYEGRVYNVDVHDGRGVLQMLVRDCPSGERCPLWVSYSAATEVAVESWVRIYGTVTGEQQFRSTSGEVRTVPSVDAAFVLPARP